MKYSEEEILNDLRFIYEKYGELSNFSINDSQKKYGTISISTCNKLGNRKKLYELIGKTYNEKTFYDLCVENNHM